ncbi:SDR family oxidoreductase [Mesorhizobium sp. VK24D]|uniref:SDR family oxidoreductase n=1 Tax=Mesorhizobium album TaxID=3072314 RepID=A0ABU4Y2F7_9HYPH|nr:SDR family oxidoreductase [Mesorhizobium sp. VK24D]MDX8481136.1 SDR family oxidoreductase [Mesorhizobium sp. VK24D]
MHKVLIIGATSAIAEATARLFAEDGDRLFLVARRKARLEAAADDLAVRGAEIAGCEVLDVNELDRHRAVLTRAEQALGGIDVALVAHGTLPDQQLCQASAKLTVEEIQTNAVSTVALLTRLSELMERKGKGQIAVVTSVAAERGRQSNYVYGAAKAAVDTFLEGLRQRLYKVGVGVTTIRPGFVDTPMTAGFEKGLLWAQPETVARRIHHAILKGKDVVYVPSFWRWIILAIRLMPRRIFKVMKL